jgi:hypothetical protein
MRAIRISSLVLTIALTAQAAGACTFKSALGNMVVTTAGGEAAQPAPAQPGPAAEAQPQGDEFRWNERMAPGSLIEVKGVNGEVRAEAAAGDAVEVVATKRARRSDPASVRIEVVRGGEGVTICAVYPNVKDHKPNVCQPGGGGNMTVNNNDVRVDFMVRVPAGVRFNGRTVNGGVEVSNLTGDVEAFTVNGGVRVTTTGLARAQTVNGSINVEMGNANWRGEMAFETVNGTIDILMPASLSADVSAETLNGSISTEFPMNVQGSVSRRRLEGVIGAGGRALRLRTVNGNVEIRRAS